MSLSRDLTGLRSVRGVAGLALAIVASYLQHRHVGMDPVYLNRNAVYHPLQAAGVLLVFCTGRRIIGLGSSPKE
jgi:hypothetical protein